MSDMGEITRLRAANDRLQRAADDQLRCIASLVRQLGGTALIPATDLMEDNVTITSVQEFDGIRLMVQMEVA